MARQYRLVRGDPVSGARDGGEEGQDKETVWVVLVVGLQRMSVRVTLHGCGQFPPGLLRPQDAQ